MMIFEGFSLPSYFYPSNLVRQDGHISVPLTEESQLVGLVDVPFGHRPTLWNILPLEISLTLLTVCKALKTWFSASSWDPNCVQGPVSWLN